MEKPNMGWLCTFNDMTTLLIVFFVLLFSMSDVKTEGKDVLAKALRAGIGVLGKGQKTEISSPSIFEPIVDPDPAEDSDDAGKADRENKNRQFLEKMRDALKDMGGADVVFSLDGIMINLSDKTLFNVGSADLLPGSYALLDRVIGMIKDIPVQIRVEGHTDNIPIYTRRFPSNWELSMARSLSVVHYFQDKGKFIPSRLSAAGYGEMKPIASNDTDEGRSANRRVEIFLNLELEVVELEEGKKE